MKLRYTLLLFYLSLTISAQEVMVYYNVSFKTDSLQDNFEREEAVLDLSKDAVKFYSTEYLKADSLQKQTNERQFAYPKLTYRVKRAINTSNNTEYVIVSTDYYALPSDDIQDWKILDDTKTVNGIKLRKAMTQYGNRDWEAWFSEDYPISEGPYKFRGLPGLIFELRDTKEIISFPLIEL
ncbi:GLPGLI family protein [Riemerella columbina]|uniref:GLPGLI family protein n=1 Tax=Riemerella columbina TaxID=103810 RepID=UPI0003633BCA|nr:GLPGLI family protein [Riemerella columbina]